MTGRLFAKLLTLYPLHRPFYFVQNNLPKLNITWSKRIKANYKTQGTSAYIIIGVDGFYEDGTRVSGNVYYDVTKRRIIDNIRPLGTHRDRSAPPNRLLRFAKYINPKTALVTHINAFPTQLYLHKIKSIGAVDSYLP